MKTTKRNIQRLIREEFRLALLREQSNEELTAFYAKLPQKHKGIIDLLRQKGFTRFDVPGEGEISSGTAWAHHNAMDLSFRLSDMLTSPDASCFDVEAWKERYIDEDICFDDMQDAASRIDQLFDPEYTSPQR